MIYADDLLTTIVNSNGIKQLLPRPVTDTLGSIHRNAQSESYITENQSKLVLRLIKEHRGCIVGFEDDVDTVLTSPKWRQPFRRIEVVKQAYIDRDLKDDPILVVEMSQSASVRRDTWDCLKTFNDVTAIDSNRKYGIPLTEQNIVKVVDTFRPRGFDISAEIIGHYDTIKSWTLKEFADKFSPDQIASNNFQKLYTTELSNKSAMIQCDRRIRHQYKIDADGAASTLTEQIAFRTDRKIWVDNTVISLTQVLASLNELERLPVLIVFDSWADEANFRMMQQLEDAFENNGITDVGVYFRLQNSEYGRQFNQLISEKQYNKRLDNNLKVAVVQSGKLPKFFLKTDWQPMSAIALDTRMGLRHGKVSVYLNNTDLIIEHAKEPALLDIQVKWP
jgi:hypothetical protein